MVVLAVAVIAAQAQAQESAKGGPLRSTQRAAYCAKTHDSDFYAGWVKNRCSKAPYGTKFEYLRPAWDCLCLGRED